MIVLNDESYEYLKTADVYLELLEEFEYCFEDYIYVSEAEKLEDYFNFTVEDLKDYMREIKGYYDEDDRISIYDIAKVIAHNDMLEQKKKQNGEKRNG